MTDASTHSERRSETREILNQYRSIEIDLQKNLPVFQFQLRDISPCGLGIIVKEDSEVLEHLKAGQMVTIRYNPKNPHDTAYHIKTEIRHVTHVAEGRYSGHYLIGFAILKEN